MLCYMAGQPQVGKNSTFRLRDPPEKCLKMLRSGSILKSQKTKENIE